MSGEEVLLGSWELLPEHLLVSIFLYLTPAQRLLAALACKAWSTCLNHPQLWRQFVCSFTLPHHEKMLKALEQNGHQIRIFDLKVNQLEEYNRINACKALHTLALNEERKLVSLSVHFVGQNPLFYAGQEFINELKLLFGCGTKTGPLSYILHVDLSGLDVALDDSLFDVLSANQPQLKSLNIQNRSLVCKVTQNCMCRLATRCRKLERLLVFHISLSDDVLLALAEPDTPSLQHLSIMYRRETKYTEDLSSEAWDKLVKKCPNLSVTLSFDHTCPLNRISEVMKPEIPVTSLHLETFTRIYEELNQAVSYYHKTLEKVVLQTRDSDELSMSLIRLAENCLQLHTLLVYCILKKTTVDRILELCPDMKRRGSYILKWEMEEGPWVVGAETDHEVQERLVLKH